MTTVPPHADNGNPIPNASGIYKITCTANKRIYIGSALNLYGRKAKHFSLLRRNTHHNPILQNAWNKYGESAFTFEVLEYVLPISLTAREQYWFKKLKPFGRKGFNIDREAGSRLGFKFTHESREKMRQSHLGQVSHNRGKKASPETREKQRQAKLGKKRTSESIEKTRQAHLGVKRSPETRAKIGNANTGKKRTPEAKAKMRQAKLGRVFGKRTPEHCENIRQSKLGHEVSLETREKLRQANLGKKRRTGHGQTG